MLYCIGNMPRIGSATTQSLAENRMPLGWLSNLGRWLFSSEPTPISLDIHLQNFAWTTKVAVSTTKLPFLLSLFLGFRVHLSFAGCMWFQGIWREGCSILQWLLLASSVDIIPIDTFWNELLAHYEGWVYFTLDDAQALLTPIFLLGSVSAAKMT